MQKFRIAMMVGGALFAVTSVAGAQLRGNVTPGQMPSPGMCRVWIDGVPANRQPAQTDCETARRTLPANAHILYGPGTTATSQVDPRRGTGAVSDPRRGSDGRYDQRDGRYSTSEQERIALARQRAVMAERARLARERERLEEQRRREWKKAHRKEHGKKDHNHDRDHDRDNDRDRNARDTVRDPRRG